MTTITERDKLYRHYLSLHFTEDTALRFVGYAEEYAREVAVHYFHVMCGKMFSYPHRSNIPPKEAYEAFDKWMEETNKSR